MLRLNYIDGTWCLAVRIGDDVIFWQSHILCSWSSKSQSGWWAPKLTEIIFIFNTEKLKSINMQQGGHFAIKLPKLQAVWVGVWRFNIAISKMDLQEKHWNLQTLYFASKIGVWKIESFSPKLLAQFIYITKNWHTYSKGS